MRNIIAAWLVGEGIIVYRSVSRDHRPPLPAELLGAAGLFVMLAFLAESQKAAPLAITLAWGFDAAALLNLSPQILSNKTATAKTAPAK